MQKEVTKEVHVDNFRPSFTSKLNKLNKGNNPYTKLIIEKMKEFNIPFRFIDYTTIKHIDNRLTLIFNYTIQVPSPNKTEILALCETNENYNIGYIKTDSGIYKTTIENSELELDYFLSKNIKILKNTKDELDFINSSDIPFLERYLRTLKLLFLEYFNEDCSLVQLKRFLGLDSVKLYIIQEDKDSISDTLPRDELYEMYLTAKKKGTI